VSSAVLKSVYQGKINPQLLKVYQTRI